MELNWSDAWTRALFREEKEQELRISCSTGLGVKVGIDLFEAGKMTKRVPLSINDKMALQFQFKQNDKYRYG